MVKHFAVCAVASITVVVVSVQVTSAGVMSVDETMLGAFGMVNQSNVPPGNGDNSCAPTATMNFFTFLEMLLHTYTAATSTVIPHSRGGQGSWTKAAALLAGPDFMDTDADSGTSEGDWVNGKVRYLNMYAPGKTNFAGMDSDTTANRPA